MISLVDFCREQGQDPRAAFDLMKVLTDRITFDRAREDALIAQRGASREERLPLRDEGDDFGRIVWRMPGKAFFHLMKQKNFGEAGLNSADGDKDVLKAFPQFRVKTVSGKVMGVGFGAGKRTKVKTYNN